MQKLCEICGQKARTTIVVRHPKIVLTVRRALGHFLLFAPLLTHSNVNVDGGAMPMRGLDTTSQLELSHVIDFWRTNSGKRLE